MSNITDVLNEKFGTTGSNIAESISQIENGGGSNSGTGSGMPVVDMVMDSSLNLAKLDVTARDLFALVQTGPVSACDKTNSADGIAHGFIMGYTGTFTNPEADAHVFVVNISGNDRPFVAASDTDHPVEQNSGGGGFTPT